MDDVEQAKALIQAIRRAKHVDEQNGQDETATDLTNALKMYVLSWPLRVCERVLTVLQAI